MIVHYVVCIIFTIPFQMAILIGFVGLGFFLLFFFFKTNSIQKLFSELFESFNCPENLQNDPELHRKTYLLVVTSAKQLMVN